MIEEFRLSRKALEWLCNRCVNDYSLAIVQPGEAVGALAAQSNGEPQQQMTLYVVNLLEVCFNVFGGVGTRFTMPVSVLRTLL